MNKNLLAILIFLIIVGAFCWYVYRPSQISESCEKSAEVVVMSDGSTQQITNSNLVNFRYQECLRQNGIINTNVTSNYTPSQDTITIQPAP
jgi:uncharacterized protein (UPF0333 family)